MNAIEQAIEAMTTALSVVEPYSLRVCSKLTNAITELQSMQAEAEPIGWTWRSYCGVQFTSMPNLAGVLQSTGAKLTPVYTHPQSPAVVDSFGIIPLDMRYAEPKARIENSMKSQCMGEFSWQEEAPYYDEDGELHEDYVATHAVPWDICKDIYQKMASIAMLPASQSGKGE